MAVQNTNVNSYWQKYENGSKLILMIDKKIMENNNVKGMRISKALARAGLCSRREAERWVRAGRVSVGSRTLRDPAFNVIDTDVILIDGLQIPAIEPTRLWRYHKPPGLITSNTDPDGRPTVFDKFPEGFPRVISVGRLDINSEGLLLLTNDGNLARRMELPRMGWSRRYRVRVYGQLDQKRLDSLKNGITISGIHYAPLDVRIESKMGRNSWLEVILKEGKNREIRNIMSELDLRVSRLIRTAFGPFQLGKLSRGGIIEIPPKALRENLNIYVKKNINQGHRV